MPKFGLISDINSPFVDKPCGKILRFFWALDSHQYLHYLSQGILVSPLSIANQSLKLIFLLHNS